MSLVLMIHSAFTISVAPQKSWYLPLLFYTSLVQLSQKSPLPWKHPPVVSQSVTFPEDYRHLLANRCYLVSVQLSSVVICLRHKTVTRWQSSCSRAEGCACVCACVIMVFFCTLRVVNIKQEVCFSAEGFGACVCVWMSRRRERRSGPYRRQIYRDMCDSHLHTLGGKREDLYVNISHRQHSGPLLLYSTLSAVCVPLTVPVCSAHHLHSFLCLSQLSLLPDWPLSPPPRAIHLFPSLSTYKFRILFLAQMWRLLMTALRRLQPCYLCLVWQDSYICSVL